MRLIFPAPTCDGFNLLCAEVVQFMNNTGFTLIETLAALIVLAIMAPVLIEARILATRTEQMTSAAENISLEIERAVVESVCGASATNQSEDACFSCSITRHAVDNEESAAIFSDVGVEKAGIAREIYRWELVSAERPSFKVNLFTRPFPE